MMQGTRQGAVIGQCKRWHPQRSSLIGVLLSGAYTIKKRELRMSVCVDNAQSILPKLSSFGIAFRN
jgi:hypothetical protein